MIGSLGSLKTGIKIINETKNNNIDRIKTIRKIPLLTVLNRLNHNKSSFLSMKIILSIN